MKPLSVALLCLLSFNSNFGGGEARNIYSVSVPNARKVVVDGTTVFGLGHPNIFVTSTVFNQANPFGKLVETTFNEAGTNQDNLWPLVCADDADGDGRSNGVELCDPDCLWRKGDADPDCTVDPRILEANGVAAATHPGFQDGPGFAGNFGGINLPPHQKAHAALMIMSWLFLAPTGILMAVFRKKAGKGAFWFKVHRACMFSAAALTLIAFLVMAFEEGTDSITGTNEHPKYGISVVALALLQPISGYFRVHLPPKGEAKSRKRLLWEFQHQWTGRIAVILAMASIATGIEFAFNNTTGGQFVIAVFGIVSIVCFIYVLGFRESPAAVAARNKEANKERLVVVNDRQEKAIEHSASREGNMLRSSLGDPSDRGMSVPKKKNSSAKQILEPDAAPDTKQTFRQSVVTSIRSFSPSVSFKKNKAEESSDARTSARPAPRDALPSNPNPRQQSRFSFKSWRPKRTFDDFNV